MDLSYAIKYLISFTNLCYFHTQQLICDKAEQIHGYVFVPTHYLRKWKTFCDIDSVLLLGAR